MGERLLGSRTVAAFRLCGESVAAVESREIGEWWVITHTHGHHGVGGCRPKAGAEGEGGATALHSSRGEALTRVLRGGVPYSIWLVGSG